MRKYILILVLCLGSLSLCAKKKVQAIISPQLTVEEEQRFLYYFYEAQRLFEEKEYQKSFELMQFCYRLNPHDAIVNQYLGDFYAGMNRQAPALAFFERSRAIDPNNEGIWMRLRELYTSLRMPDEALQAQNHLDSLNGEDIYSAITKYRCYAMKGDAKNTLAALNKCLSYDPGNAQFLEAKVQLYEFMPKIKWTEKKETYEQLLSADPYNVAVLNNYAYLLSTMRKGDLKQAESMSQQTIMAEPNNALKMSAKAVEKEPDNATYLDTYAWILYLRGEQSLAELYIRQAVSLLGDDIPKEVKDHYKKIIKSSKSR